MWGGPGLEAQTFLRVCKLGETPCVTLRPTLPVFLILFSRYIGNFLGLRLKSFESPLFGMKVEVDVPEGMSESQARFVAEKEFRRRMKRLENISEAVESLNLDESDLDFLEEAREEAWEERKENL